MPLFFCVLAWTSCYVYTVEVRTPVYNLWYINRLEVLMKVLLVQAKGCLYVQNVVCVTSKSL